MLCLTLNLEKVNMGKALTMIMLATLAGCAATPSSIQPAAVSRVSYTTMSCKVLEMELTREISNLEGLSGEQQSSRNWDFALNVLLIPGFGALTDDQEDEIAQSKGKIIVMQDEYTMRCIDDG